MVHKRVLNALLMLGVVIVIVVAATILDFAFLRNGATVFQAVLVSNILIGMLCAFAVIERTQRKAYELETLNDRLQIISDMSHQLRNVLGVLSVYGKQASNPQLLKLFDDAFKRMEFMFRGVVTRWNLAKPNPVEPSPSMPRLRGRIVRERVHWHGRRPSQCSSDDVLQVS